MNSLIVPGGEAPSHVTRHDWSFCRHVIATQTATERHAGSLGQLVALGQQLVSTQVAQDDAAAAKISVAPGQFPASVIVTTTGVVPASRGGVDIPPPGGGVPQATPSTGLHAPSCGGLPSGGEGDEDEQATSAAIAPASVAYAKDEFFEAMAIGFSWAGVARAVKGCARVCLQAPRRPHGRAHFPSDRDHCSLLALEGPRLDRF
jgi:hypothetical protein